MPTLVPGSGSYHASLLFVGEAPGRTEETKGQPFVGATGQIVRSALRRSGIDIDTEVRFNNVIPVRVKPTPALIRKWEHHLAEDLERMSPRVIVACGGAALTRLLGTTGIKDAHGGVYERGDALVIPCIHPAAVMRTKIQAERLSIEKVLERACNYAMGSLRYEPRPIEIIYNLAAEELDGLLAAHDRVIVDAEFDPKEQHTYMLGLSFEDPYVVYSLDTHALREESYRRVLSKHFMRRDLLKVAQHHMAEIDALSWRGIETCEPWFDTMVAFALLYPDLPCGLSHIARFYLDDVRDWKDMSTEDPKYNAIDVSMTSRIYAHIVAEMEQANMWDVYNEEVVEALPLLYGLEWRGLQVDAVRLKERRKRNGQEARKLCGKVKKQVQALFDRRIEPHLQLIEDAEHNIKVLERNPTDIMCYVHPSYTGLRKKRWAANKDCSCRDLYDLRDASRTTVAALRKQIMDARTKIKRWERGFDPDNNDHVRWLLYDKRALGLPVQRHPDTKQPTANATAIARLIALKTVGRRADVVQLLQDIKRYQHLRKLGSTFLKPPTDNVGRVHPSYRMHGTGTGRPASGDDDYLHEKGVSSYKFNALNITGEVREIYVP